MVLCMLDDSPSCAFAVRIATGGPHLVDTGGLGAISFLFSNGASILGCGSYKSCDKCG